jgi:hypothetical protein
MRRMAKKPKAPKAQKTKASAKTRGVNKSAFVRELSDDLSAADVVEAAAKKGIKLSAAQVYTIRANARRADAKGGASTTKAPSVAVEGGAPASGAATKNRSAFIRSLPVTMPAAEVVARAKATGLTLNAGLVYAVRSASRGKGMDAAAPSGARSSAKLGTLGQGSIEKQFVSLALDLGLANAEALIARVRARVRDLSYT